MTPTASEIIRLRTSRRTYRPEPLSGELTDKILQKLAEITVGPLGTPLTFSLIRQEDPQNRKLKLGTYGFIQGAGLFIAGQIKPSQNAFLDYGYELEKLILALTDMQLGTCWLGGTFDRGEFAKAIRLNEGYLIPAITPVGMATATRGLGDRVIRLGAGSKNRLPPERLFFDKNPSTPLTPAESDPLYTLLQSVRLGPSASNNQPWRIVADGNLFRFYLSRKPGYRNTFGRVDMQMIDMGIAMAHFDLVAREKGWIPEWETASETPGFAGWEYVISVLLPV